MTHDDTDDPSLNAYCPCCGYSTTKHPTNWECRRCGALSDSEDWLDGVYSWHKLFAHLDDFCYVI